MGEETKLPYGIPNNVRGYSPLWEGDLIPYLTAHPLPQWCALSNLLQRTRCGRGEKGRLHREEILQTRHHPGSQGEHLPGRHVDNTDL